ncbi:shikimate dehydrogenase [Candidatus Gottesmanbacteria bacterium]|nr:shikimate dehydrogenase [Candidatus Gottesmanbacteria bacterium]
MSDAKTKLCCLIGNPVDHSLSPQMFNHGFQCLKLNFAYVACRVTDVQKALEGIRALQIVGINVTIPHKVSVLKYVDRIDSQAREIGAANIIINKNGKLIASNSDWIGAVRALREKTTLRNKKIAVIGAGGAARAIIYGLKKNGADVSIWNRTIKGAQKLVKEFSLQKAYELNNRMDFSTFDIIINATAIGMTPRVDLSPIPASAIFPHHIIFDIVYTPSETKLLKMAKEKGATPIFGYKMLLYGGAASFEAFTGRKAPVVAMEKSLRNYD